MRVWQYVTWRVRDVESADLQEFWKRLMGLEPTTFCMASRRSSQLSYSRASGEYSPGVWLLTALKVPALTLQPGPPRGVSAYEPNLFIRGVAVRFETHTLRFVKCLERGLRCGGPFSLR